MMFWPPKKSAPENRSDFASPEVTTTDIRLGIIGNPLTHTLSPQLHEFFLQQLGLSGEYNLYPTERRDLQTAIQELASSGITGVNVTVPHKVAAVQYLDQLSEEVHLTGAVNTLLFQNGKTIGFNTDVSGFTHSLPDSVKARVSDSPTLVVGAGGAARAIMAALVQLKVPAITLAIREPDRGVAALNMGERMCHLLHHHTSFTMVEIKELEGLKGYELIINATPVGMAEDKAPVVRKGPLHIANPPMPLSLAQLHTLNKTAYVYDLVYDESSTEMVRHARNIGLEAQDGLSMLAHQGAYAFQKWTDRLLSRSIIEEATELLRKQL